MFTLIGTTDALPEAIPAPGKPQGPRGLWFANLRRGISLLEVLFAVFILSMGMLGLGALIPVGNFQVSEGLRADHAAACARSAFREIEARGLLNPALWKHNSGNAPAFISGGQAQWPTFMLDPLARVRGVDGTYPYAGANAPTMGRMTLPGMLPNSDTTEQLKAISLAEAVFRWRDDLVGGEEGERPRYLGGGNPDTAAPTALAPFTGDYSWMAMITPSLVDSTAAVTLTSNLTKRQFFTVAVVVFNKRDLAVEGNREPARNLVQILPDSFNADALALMLPDSTAEEARIVPGQWIMLSHRIQNGTDVGGTMPFHRWYRVVSVGTRNLGKGSPFGRIHVQLDGPPWPSALIDTSLRPANQPAVTIHQGVVGVYERTMEFNPNALTTP